jgi:hypothetical protein
MRTDRKTSPSELPSISIRAALAGNQYGLDDNPNMPFGIKALVKDATKCIAAGASELHIHLRAKGTGEPVFAPEKYKAIKDGIYEKLRKDFPESPEMWHPVISFTTTQKGIESDAAWKKAGRPTAEQDPATFARLRGQPALSVPDVIPITDPSTKVRDGDVEGEAYGRAIIQASTLAKMATENNVGHECEIQHPYFIKQVEDLQIAGALEAHPRIQTLFGNPRNMPIERLEETIDDINDRLKPKTLILGIRFPATCKEEKTPKQHERRGIIKPAILEEMLGLALKQRPDGQQKITGVRVGLEDNFSIEGRKPEDVTNSEMVNMVAQMAKRKGLHINTPEEARQIQELPLRETSMDEQAPPTDVRSAAGQRIAAKMTAQRRVSL